MKNLTLFLAVTAFAGCLTNDNIVVNVPSGGNTRNDRVAQYLHLAVGDSLGYNNPGVAGTGGDLYTVVEGMERFRGKEYFRVNSFPFEGGGLPDFLMREDRDGNVFVVGGLLSGTTIDSTETTLYKTAAAVGSSWNFFYYYETFTCTLESRDDTVTTTAGVFPHCLRFKLESWLDTELQWLAPGVGLVKREFSTISARAVFMPWLDVNVLRLKTATGR